MVTGATIWYQSFYLRFVQLGKLRAALKLRSVPATIYFDREVLEVDLQSGLVGPIPDVHIGAGWTRETAIRIYGTGESAVVTKGYVVSLRMISSVTHPFCYVCLQPPFLFL